MIEASGRPPRPVAALRYTPDTRELCVESDAHPPLGIAVSEVWIRWSGDAAERVVVVPREEHAPLLHLSLDPEGESPPRAVRFRRLSAEESEEILIRNHVGRLGFVRDGEPRIVPIHYVYRSGTIYGRTSPASELVRTVRDGDPVVFEVDEVADVFRWCSTVARGPILVLPGQAVQRNERGRAIGLLRTFIPETLSDHDPAPQRTCIFRIPVEAMSGRAAAPALAD